MTQSNFGLHFGTTEPINRKELPTRRQFLKLTGSAGAHCAYQAFGAPAWAAGPQASFKPRYYVLILMSGGHDTVYTTDPKTRSQVRQGIALPKRNHIRESGKLRFGPHIHPLAEFADQLSFLNGVQVGTANHDTGFMQYSRLKTNVTQYMPSVLDIIGLHRDSQPLPAAYLNVWHPGTHTPGFFGTANSYYLGPEDVFERSESLSPEEQRALAQVLERQAKSIQGTSSEAEKTAENLRQAAKWFQRMPSVRPFQQEFVADDYVSQAMAESMQLSLIHI